MIPYLTLVGMSSGGIKIRLKRSVNKGDDDKKERRMKGRAYKKMNRVQRQQKKRRRNRNMNRSFKGKGSWKRN